MKHPLTASIDGDLEAALHAVAALPGFRSRPIKGSVDGKRVPLVPSWLDVVVRGKWEGRADWYGDAPDGLAQLVSVHARRSRILFQWPDAFTTLEELLALIETLPFGVCAVDTLYPDDWGPPELETFSFGRGHVNLGFGAAFRGAGHARLVSRRWLEFGPWRVVKRPDDLTFVQFHDFAADPQTALAQAVHAWSHMGPSPVGGYIASDLRFTAEVEGLYTPDTRMFEIVVPPGGTVEPWRMLAACAVRLRHGVEAASARPIEQVAFVFLDAGDAQRHLHELWLRELEVWIADAGGRRRIDDTYSPQPDPPEWVRRTGG